MSDSVHITITEKFGTNVVIAALRSTPFLHTVTLHLFRYSQMVIFGVLYSEPMATVGLDRAVNNHFIREFRDSR